MGSPSLPLPLVHFNMFAVQFGYLGRENQNGFRNMCPEGGGSGEECLFPYIFHLFIPLLFLLFTNFGPAKKH